MKDLLAQANLGLNGSLDPGMGFESLKGAILCITKISTMIHEGKTWTHYDYETKYVGNLTRKEKTFLNSLL